MPPTDRKVPDPKSNKKNKPKDGNGNGWSVEDLYFDEEGCLYIANKDLADAIQASLDSWGEHLTIWRYPEDGQTPSLSVRKRRDLVEARLRASEPEIHEDTTMPRAGDWNTHALEDRGPASGQGVGHGTYPATMRNPDVTTAPGTKEEVGPKVNMMCPCAPEP